MGRGVVVCAVCRAASVVVRRGLVIGGGRGRVDGGRATTDGVRRPYTGKDQIHRTHHAACGMRHAACGIRHTARSTQQKTTRNVQCMPLDRQALSRWSSTILYIVVTYLHHISI